MGVEGGGEEVDILGYTCKDCSYPHLFRHLDSQTVVFRAVLMLFTAVPEIVQDMVRYIGLGPSPYN